MDGGRGGGLVRPPGVSKLSVVELSEKNSRLAYYSRKVLAIGGAICYSRSIFDPFMRGQMSFFAKYSIFFNFSCVYLKIINRSDLKPSPGCSPFNAEQT